MANYKYELAKWWTLHVLVSGELTKSGLLRYLWKKSDIWSIKNKIQKILLNVHNFVARLFAADEMQVEKIYQCSGGCETRVGKTRNVA